MMGPFSRLGYCQQTVVFAMCVVDHLLAVLMFVVVIPGESDTNGVIDFIDRCDRLGVSGSLGWVPLTFLSLVTFLSFNEKALGASTRPVPGLSQWRTSR